jgi:hypothetical protein
VNESRAKLEAARTDRNVAITNIKGKKIYRYLFEELSLRGRAFTQRTFADQIIGRVRVTKPVEWIDDLERLAKRGLGNALGQVLLSPVDTDREIRASFDRQGRATRPVVDSRVSFRSAFQKAFRPLSRPTGEPSRHGSGSPFRSSGGAPLPD